MVNSFSISLSVKTVKRSVFFLLSTFLILHLLSAGASCGNDRRINTALLGSFTILDADYFGLDYAAGVDLAFRYEFYYNLFLESRLGSFACSSNGGNIHGFSSQIGIVAYSSHFLPFQPGLRAGLGLLSANPVTVTPTDTFKPSQTTFYFIIGCSLGRFVWKAMTVEMGADILFAPYEYTKYTFNRQSVFTEDVQFTHYTFTLGASYSF
ncbi:MAG: hypothetical protein JW746_08140 [Candidatus Krumholzibacteriota bacterium]|nr:hypothetical protein [Candidatus Krumholzibacteriota bacterium]